ncbi:hypothetical protein PsorP6_004788 [Peronosclerospora sorghi]|uniref:Uncharacterized protein n=1 Tax=Peronosclerospora sorghi TaxID=230839 RepID=A0ACC0VN52_9STRA|nr:hypothetical protein PsorP6_004788 [Peronosclerospora sorghi]
MLHINQLLRGNLYLLGTTLATSLESSVVSTNEAVMVKTNGTSSAANAAALPSAPMSIHLARLPLFLVEVFASSTMAPFILNKRSIPLLEKSSNPRRFIINVSAMEGKFYRSKTPNHPHTNMGNAAANMMTTTCAEDFSRKGIYMNSVDTVSRSTLIDHTVFATYMCRSMHIFLGLDQ